MQLVTNPSANLRLRSGIAPIASALEIGGSVFAIGLDGTGLDDDRVISGGRCGSSISCRAVVTRRDGWTAQDIFDAAIRVGGQVINANEADDFTIIDYQALIAEALFYDLDEAEVLLTRMSAKYARGLIVAGREVMRQGELTGIDFDAASSGTWGTGKS